VLSLEFAEGLSCGTGGLDLLPHRLEAMCIPVPKPNPCVIEEKKPGCCCWLTVIKFGVVGAVGAVGAVGVVGAVGAVGAVEVFLLFGFELLHEGNQDDDLVGDVEETGVTVDIDFDPEP
jgi:hypothetical protein